MFFKLDFKIFFYHTKAVFIKYNVGEIIENKGRSNVLSLKITHKKTHTLNPSHCVCVPPTDCIRTSKAHHHDIQP